MAIIEEVVGKIPDWKNKRVFITPLSGGLTNSNYKVEVDGLPYFVRVRDASTELLVVNRENEYHTLNLTSGAGRSNAGAGR